VRNQDGRGSNCMNEQGRLGRSEEGTWEFYTRKGGQCCDIRVEEWGPEKQGKREIVEHIGIRKLNLFMYSHICTYMYKLCTVYFLLLCCMIYAI
jgi:hypothetical protein